MADDYQFVPVDHDPMGFVPVDHDPFVDMPGMITRPTGTQQWQSAIEEQRQREAMKPSAAEQVEAGSRALRGAVGDFTKGGLTEVLRNNGVQLPDWSNRISDFAQSEPVNAALGVMTPMKAGIAGAASKAVPLAKVEGETSLYAPGMDRSHLLELAWGGKEGLAAVKAKDQRLADAIRKGMESFWSNEPKGRLPPDTSFSLPGYHWEGGKLVPDGAPAGIGPASERSPSNLQFIPVNHDPFKK